MRSWRGGSDIHKVLTHKIYKTKLKKKAQSKFTRRQLFIVVTSTVVTKQ